MRASRAWKRTSAPESCIDRAARSAGQSGLGADRLAAPAQEPAGQWAQRQLRSCALLRPPPERVGGMTCRELVEAASLPHFQLWVDRKCRLVMARRTTTPFQGTSEIRDCFRAVQIKLADIPRKSYHLLVDARFGPSRNDRGFELVLEEERGKLLFGFARNAALAATAAGRLQIQRFAKHDGREVFATDDPSQAFDYLGLRPHLV